MRAAWAMLIAAGITFGGGKPEVPLRVVHGGTGTTTGGITTATMAAPVNGTFSTACTGGSLVHSTTYYYRVTATNAAGETLASTETSKATGTCAAADTSTITVTWAAVVGATGYNVYGRTTGAETKITGSIGTVGLSFTDTAGATSGALPSRNSTADEVHVGVAGVGSVTTAALPAACANGALVWDSTATTLKVCSSNTWAAVASPGVRYLTATTTQVAGAQQSYVVESAATLTADIVTVARLVGVSGGPHTAKVALCDDGGTCDVGGGHVYYYCTIGCDDAVGTITSGCNSGAGIQKSAVSASTTLTWNVTGSCNTMPAWTVSARMTVP